jgi:hypothetical protein
MTTAATITPGKGSGRPAPVLFLLALEVVVDLEGRLAEKEKPAAHQDYVASREGIAKEGEELDGEPGDPGQRQEEDNAHHHRSRQAEGSRPRPQLLRQTPRQDRDEDDVVDAEDDLERGQGRQRDPRLETGDPFEHWYPHRVDVVAA